MPVVLSALPVAVVSATIVSNDARPPPKKRLLGTSTTHPPRAKRQQSPTTYNCEHCGKTGDHFGNHKRHMMEVHKVGIRCPICHTLCYDKRAYMEHLYEAIISAHAPTAKKGLPLCVAIDWTTFSPNPSSVCPSKVDVYKALEDFESYLREEPSSIDRDIIKRKAHTKPATIKRALDDVWLCTELAHSLFPGVFDEGFRFSVLVEQKVVSAVIQAYQSRPGLMGQATLSESRMSDLYGNLKKLLGCIARRTCQDTRFTVELTDVGAWEFLAADCKKNKLSIVTQREYRQTPAGQEEEKLTGKHIKPEEMLFVGKECCRLMSELEQAKATTIRDRRCDSLSYCSMCCYVV